jgi:RHS repeat-associated protein
LKSVQALVQINAEDVPATTYTYDEAGNKLTQTDAKGRTTIWTYDYFGRVLSRTLPEGMVETFSYDDANRTVNHTDFNGKATTSITNAMGRTDSIIYHDGKVETFTYWANGQVKNATMSETGKDDVVTSYTYDNRDRLNIETQPDGTVLTYHYDEAGNRDQVSVTRTTVSGEQTTISDYRYDALNRLATVIDSSGTTTYTYDDVGNQKTVVYPNGLATTYIYNDVNQLKNLTTKNANGEVLSSYSYELENTGRREAITEQDGRYTDYRYDNLYRLTDEIIKQGIDAAAVDYSANYQYDWVGNRSYETVDGVQTAYSYDLNDRLTSQGGTSYTHDDNGNTLTETLDATVKTYAYDAKDKLIGVSTAESDIEVSSSAYSYNVNGIRDSKTEGGVTTSYVVDSNRDYAQVLEEIVDGLSTVTYSYGHDLVSQNREGDFRFYQYDGLGSTRGLSNSAGVVTDTYDYEAFGEVLNETGTTDNNYKFTGEQFDSSLDQYYLRARYYDQGVGRFTQQDTYMGNNSDPVSLHKYMYANADPVTYTDPTGNMSLASIGASLTGFGILSTIAYSSGQNALSLDGAMGSEFDGVLTNKEMGILSLLIMNSNSVLWDMVFKDGGDSNSVSRVEDVLQLEVENLRNRDSEMSIAVPRPPRKKGWYTCIARAQDLGRSSGNVSLFGWGWGMSKDFQTAKNNAVQMANTSIGAIDTHHAQWRCLDPKGNIRRP